MLIKQNLETFDTEFALSQFSGNESLLIKILDKFVEQNQDFPAQLTQSLNEQDMVTAKRLVHTLKGVTGNLGMHALHQASKALEPQIDQSPSPSILQDFYQLLEHTVVVAKNYGIDDIPNSAGTPAPSNDSCDQNSNQTINAIDNSSATNKLISVLERDEFLSDAKLSQYIQDIGLSKEDGDKLIQLIDDFDYPNAITMLKS